MSDTKELQDLCKFFEKVKTLTYQGEVNPEYPPRKKICIKGVWSKELDVSKEDWVNYH